MSRTPDMHDRRERYLKYAAEAEAAAVRCHDLQAKDAYATIAKSWSVLAHELDTPASGEDEFHHGD